LLIIAGDDVVGSAVASGAACSTRFCCVSSQPGLRVPVKCWGFCMWARRRGRHGSAADLLTLFPLIRACASGAAGSKATVVWQQAMVRSCVTQVCGMMLHILSTQRL
jgi:hypothetical protein